MRHTVIKWLLLTFCVVGVLSCASTKRIAYTSLSVVAISVDQSMQAWGEYVKAGKATHDQEVRVSTAYSHYQTVMKKAAVAVRYDMAQTAPEDVLEAKKAVTELIAILSTI